MTHQPQSILLQPTSHIPSPRHVGSHGRPPQELVSLAYASWHIWLVTMEPSRQSPPSLPQAVVLQPGSHSPSPCQSYELHLHVTSFNLQLQVSRKMSND